MIKYILRCCKGHEFESWFSNSNEFDKLNKKNLLECIYCSSNNIKKSIMAPMISGSKKDKDENTILLKENLSTKKNELLRIRKFVEKNFEYVGDKFSQKVREVYYDRNTKKSIYGTTTPEERDELTEEGIDLISIPWVSKDN